MWNRIWILLLFVILQATCHAQRIRPLENLTLLGKSNALLWAATVPNVGAELVVNNRYSIDFPIVYCPYTVKRDYNLKSLLFLPEFRYYINTSLRGHFVGVHAHIGYFSVATNNTTRYQDRGADSPLWGFGLSYGYRLPLSSRWNVEFTAGLGYANIRYDAFYNIPHGAQYDAGTKNYFGLTRLGVSFVYRIKDWRLK